jgi:hypothetical protein
MLFLIITFDFFQTILLFAVDQDYKLCNILQNYLEKYALWLILEFLIKNLRAYFHYPLHILFFIYGKLSTLPLAKSCIFEYFPQLIFHSIQAHSPLGCITTTKM